MLNRRLKNSIVLILLVIASSAMAQEIFVGSGFSTASFEDYENSSGENTLDDSGYSKSKQPLIESGIRFDLYKERVKFDIGLSYNKYEIKTSFYSGNIRIPMAYNLSYVGAKVGLKVDILRWKKFGLQGHVHLYHDWLMQGTNTYANQVIDLYKDNTLDRGLMGFHRGFGLEYRANKKIACYINYNIATSFKESNQDTNEGESYVLDARSIRFGVVFNISKKKKAEKKTAPETEAEKEVENEE